YNKMPAISKNIIEKQLGYWCADKRRDKLKGILDNKKIVKLEALNGWYWNRNDIFNETYNEVEKFIIENNKLPSQMSKNATEKYLGRWCSTRRSDKNRKKLDATKIKKLELLSGWYWSPEEIKQIKTFDEIYDDVKKYMEKNIKLPIYLNNWCIAQRRKKRNMKL